MELVFDIETDDLNATTIWCIVAVDENDKVYTFDPSQIDEGIKLLQSADKLIGHNIIGFDIPVIKKLKGIDLYHADKVIDTLVLSRLFKPTRESGHGLEAWGYKLNVRKQDKPDFENYSKEMLTYCTQDVILNKRLFDFLKKESAGFSKESINIEHEITQILTQQKDNGFKFDLKQATELVSILNEKLKQVEHTVQEVFKPRWVDVKKVTPKLRKDGTLSKVGLTDYEYEEILQTKNYKPFMRKALEEFNLGSRKQIGEYLIKFGWKPNKFTPTGQPIVDEGTLKKITHIHEAKLIADYLLYQKRIAQINSWIEAVENDDRVHGSVISTGTITGRMSHRNPNMAQVPSVSSEYGKECRACWTVDEGNVLLGVDASGLELRMLAHYMDDKEYTNAILNGDIHTTNQKLAGLKSRDQAKTFIYALIYGAGDEKIGTIIGGSRAAGKKLRERFLSSLPAYKSLKERVDRAAEKGFLKGLDGRKILLRHKHAALNTLLQGGGAIVMKKALCILDKRLRQCGVDFKFVANIHDEWQIEVKECQANRVGQLAVQSIVDAGTYFNMRCPLDGEFKIGGSWDVTH
jgi:DNA polymerase-1